MSLAVSLKAGLTEVHFSRAKIKRVTNTTEQLDAWVNPFITSDNPFINLNISSKVQTQMYTNIAIKGSWD